jgi:hypothetical protein
MLHALTCLAALSFGVAPEAKPLYLEVTLFEQQPSPGDYSPKSYVGSVPAGAVVLATLSTKIELGKTFAARTCIGERCVEVAGTVKETHVSHQPLPHDDPCLDQISKCLRTLGWARDEPPPTRYYVGNVQLSCHPLQNNGGRDGLRMVSGLVLRPNEQEVQSIVVSSSVNVTKWTGFLGLETMREQKYVRQGYAIRLMEQPSVNVVTATGP